MWAAIGGMGNPAPDQPPMADCRTGEAPPPAATGASATHPPATASARPRPPQHIPLNTSPSSIPKPDPHAGGRPILPPILSKNLANFYLFLKFFFKFLGIRIGRLEKACKIPLTPHMRGRLGGIGWGYFKGVSVIPLNTPVAGHTELWYNGGTADCRRSHIVRRAYKPYSGTTARQPAQSARFKRRF